MNKIIYIIIITLLICACSKNVATTSLPVQNNFIKSEFIDFDFIKALDSYNEIFFSKSPSNNKLQDYLLLEEACKRFWSKVDLINDECVLLIKEGKDINVSERVFEGFVKQLNDANNQIKILKKGKTPVVISAPYRDPDI